METSNTIWKANIEFLNFRLSSTKNKHRIFFAMKAIETTATVKNNKQLLLDTPVFHRGKNKVRLIILLPEADDINENEWLSGAASNPAFDFLKDRKENIYTDADGRPFDHKG